MVWRKIVGCRWHSGELRYVPQKPLRFKTLPLRHLSSGRYDQEPTFGHSSLSGQSESQEEEIFLPEDRHIAPEDPQQQLDQGVSIDRHGQLKVISAEQAKKQCRTALIIRAASPNLTEADFTRLLDENRSTAESGFEAAIPGRDPETLDRLSYWIILFTSPLLAAAYQTRLRWYHLNAVTNQPINPLHAALTRGRGLSPPPGYLDPYSGEHLWKRLQEYTLLQPLQRFRICALLPEFPGLIVQAIRRHQMWNSTSRVHSWPVRLRIDGRHFSADQLAAFLQEDGRARNRPWVVLRHWLDDMPVPAPHTDNSIPPVIIEERVDAECQNFILKFCSHSESIKFWRTWHRRPIPTPRDGESVGGGLDPLLHVELMR